MVTGISRKGAKVAFKSSANHRSRCEFDVAIFYGLAGGLARVLAEYPASNRKAFYIDLGYWGRRKLTRWDGFHKIARNSRHPTDYFQNHPKSSARFDQFGIEIQPWRKSGKHVLLVGMSGMAAAAEGLRPEQWENETIARLRKLTDRPIIYRPKPNWPDARPINGSTFGGGDISLTEHLRDCHAVVTHHSNVGIDALLAGVPCISPYGVASRLSGTTLDEIENPPMPDGREQFAYDLAWTQWSVDEMRSGDAFEYLQREGLL